MVSSVDGSKCTPCSLIQSETNSSTSTAVVIFPWSCLHQVLLFSSCCTVWFFLLTRTKRWGAKYLGPCHQASCGARTLPSNHFQWLCLWMRWTASGLQACMEALSLPKACSILSILGTTIEGAMLSQNFPNLPSQDHRGSFACRLLANLPSSVHRLPFLLLSIGSHGGSCQFAFLPTLREERRSDGKSELLRGPMWPALGAQLCLEVYLSRPVVAGQFFQLAVERGFFAGSGVWSCVPRYLHGKELQVPGKCWSISCRWIFSHLIGWMELFSKLVTRPVILPKACRIPLITSKSGLLALMKIAASSAYKDV